MRLNGLKTFFLLTGMMALFMLIGGLVGGRSGVFIAFIFAVGMNFFSYWFSSSIVLKMYKANEVTEAYAPQLYTSVRRLSGAAGLPMPKVYIIETPTPNAFATGRNAKNGVVAFTTGIMRLLDTEELEGVIAHELSHIKNRDILTGTIAATFAGAVMMLANMAQWGAFLGNSQNSRGNGNAISGIILLTVAILAPLAATIVQLAVSRTREYAADASAAALTKNPFALASALEKISMGAKRIPMEANPATSHMFIINPLKGKKFATLFSTHPDVEDRIGRLLKM